MEEVAHAAIYATYKPPDFEDEKTWEEEVPGPLTRPEVHGHVGFVEASFRPGEKQLGLVIDWSMPFPVIAKVLPGSPASTRPQLYPGLVLIATNKNGLRIRCKRDEVEMRLKERPLHLVLEAPAPERFDFFGTMKLHKKKLNKMRGLPTTPLRPDMAMTMQSFFDTNPERLRNEQFGEWGEDLPLALPPPASNLSKAMNRVRSSPGALNALDDMHGTKVSGLRAMRDTVQLPPVIRGGFRALPDAWDSSAKQRMAKTGMSWSSAANATNQVPWPSAAATVAGPWRQAVSTKSLTWLGASVPRLDSAYQHLVDEPRAVGPGKPESWPLLHDDLYICRLSDMMLAWRTRDAYEVGFRGKKRDRLTQAHLTCATKAPPLIKRVQRVEEIFCDTCGVEISPGDQGGADPYGMPDDIDLIMRQHGQQPEKKGTDGKPVEPLVGTIKNTAGSFYYCRRCKRAGHRHEICPACHAVEVVQSEGKHHGKELHPHYLRCQHRNLIRRRWICDASPGMPHVRRVMCDYCGHVAGSFDQDNEIYVCTSCPERYGLRFEICEPCYSTLLGNAQGVDRMYSATL